MSGIRKAAAMGATVVSVAALATVGLGGGMLLVLEDLFGAVTGGATSGALVGRYPLGAGVLVIYAAGILAGLAALRWATPAALAMVALGACALLLGGPVARIYGVLIVLCAVAVIAPTGLRRGADRRPSPRSHG